MLVAISTLIVAIIGLGWLFRRNAKKHIPLMVLAFVLDVGLLLFIEGTRQAIHTAEVSLQTPQEHGLLLFHIAVSLITVVLYIAQISSGILLARNPGKLSFRNFHKFSAMAFIVCRLSNYVTSFFVVPT